jgi:hypothetical protein
LTDISQLQQTHQRRLDHQDSMIDNWAADLEEGEDQIQTAVAGHVQASEGLVNLQVDRLQHAWQLFDKEVAGLDTEFSSERYARRICALICSVRMLDHHEHEVKNLTMMLTRLEQDYAEADSDAKHEYQSLREDVKNKNLEEKHGSRIQLESMLEELWRQFQKAFYAASFLN